MKPTLASAAFDAVPFAAAEALHAPALQPKKARWYDAGHALDRQALIEKHEWLHARIDLDLLKPPN